VGDPTLSLWDAWHDLSADASTFGKKCFLVPNTSPASTLSIPLLLCLSHAAMESPSNSSPDEVLELDKVAVRGRRVMSSIKPG